jgi:hypothetical protein
MKDLVQVEKIEDHIYILRGQKVILDRDLAELYGVWTFALNQAVKRNKERFPEDFMFSLTRQEILRISQFVISSTGAKTFSLKFSKNVNAFTEQGIAMLSGILKSKRAIKVNIAIMRAFVKLRRILSIHKELAEKLNALEKKFEGHDSQIKTVFDAIRQIMEPKDDREKKIGFLK